MRHLKHIWLALVLLVCVHVSFSQPGNVNAYKTRQRYYLLMTDSLNGLPSDTFNLHTSYAIANTWNLYPWIASKGDNTYLWSVTQQRWIATTVPSASQVSIINDSTIQICNGQNVCDTFSVSITTPIITNVTIINDSTIQVCNINSCDTIIIHDPGPPLTTVTILNDSTIEVCNINSCDTIVVHSPLNVSIINDTTIQVCGSNIDGPELLTNGDFNGNATGWELGALWAYDANDIIHSFGSTQATAQAGGLVEGGTYRVSADIGGSTGTVDLKLDAGTSQTFSAGAGTVTFTGTWNNANNYKIVIAPSNDFDGTVTNVSLKQVLPNCDTIQIQPTFFLDTIHIFVESPLHARNDSTFYITRSSKLDSGFLSDSDFTYFWHKVDSIYTRPSDQGIDSFFYSNGDTTDVLWYVNDVISDGIISGGQILYSGTPYVYNVTPAVYRINGIRYTSPATQITIDSADASLPRTDVFYVDTSGNAAYLAGTAANPNLTPSIDVSWQLLLTSIDLTPLNPPAIIDSTIYNENVAPEWIPVTNGGTTSDADNLVSPWLGVKSIDVTNINAGDYIRFDHTGPFDLSPFLSSNGSLTGFILLKQPIPATASLRAQFFNGGTNVSPLTGIPLIKNNNTTYQGFSVPLSSFALTGNVVTHLRIQYVASNNTVNAGFFLDDINLQSGIIPTTSNTNALVRVSRAAGTDTVMGTYQDGSISYQFKDSSGGGSSAAANNGLIDSSGTIQLGTSNSGSGAPLLTERFIDAGHNMLELYGDGLGSNKVLSARIDSSATASYAIWAMAAASNDGAIFAYNSSTVSSAVTIEADARNGTSIVASSIEGLPLVLLAAPSTTNTIHTLAELKRFSSGTAANGIGGSVDFITATVNSSSARSNQIISKWTDATDASLTSQFIITGVNSAVTADLFTLSGSGAAQLNKYGVGTFTGTPATYSAWDASGNFIEVSGAGIGALITAGNGLTDSSNRIILGGTMYKATTITQINGALTFTTAVSNGTNIIANATNGGTAIVATGTGSSAIGVIGNSSGGVSAGNFAVGVQGYQSGAGGFGMQAYVDGGGVPIDLTNIHSSTNTVRTMAKIHRETSGTAAAGIGESLDLHLETDNGTLQLSNQIISKWTTAAVATRTSQYIITGVNSAVTADLFTLSGSGATQLNKYGLGTFTGTPATYAAWDASGNMIELSSIGTAPIITADNGLTKNTATNVRFGGTLLQNTTINMAGFGTTWTGNVTGNTPFYVENTNASGTGFATIYGASLGSGVGTQGSTETGVGVAGGAATSGIGVRGNSVSGTGGSFITNDGTAIIGLINPSSTNTIATIASFKRGSGGTTTNGVGGSLDLYTEAGDGNLYLSNQVISKWTDVTLGTRTSQLDITGINSTATTTIMSAYGTGVVGIGISSSYAATRLNVVDNALAGGSMVDLTSTSTLAASNVQKLVNVGLSGVNANSSQTTYGIYSSNTHSGSGIPVNYGVYGTASGATFNYGVRGDGTQTGVYGLSAGTFGVGVFGSGSGSNGFAGQFSATSTAVGVEVSSNGGLPLHVKGTPASTNTVFTMLNISRLSSGTAANGIGGGIDFNAQTDVGNERFSNQVISKWSDATDATRTSQLLITGVNSASTGDIISFEGNKRTMLYGRLEKQQGADVASLAGAIAVGLDGNVFELTGTSAVTLISNLNWVNGSTITFVFTSTATLTDGTANSGTDIGMELAGNANFVGSADDTITLLLSEMGGVQRWREVYRTVN